jgi:excisionase family DNA binding protein
MDVSEAHVKNLIYRGDLAAVKDGKALLILAEDVEAYLKKLPKLKKREKSEPSLAATD